MEDEARAHSSQVILHVADGNQNSCAAATTCGWRFFRPHWLQQFRQPKWVLFWLCWAAAIQGMVVNGFVNVVITTIERRFGLSSTETGVIAGGYDVASVLCLVPVTFIGGSGNKPRWLGYGVIVMGLGSLLFAVPHFLAGAYILPARQEVICLPDATVSQTYDVTPERTLVENGCPKSSSSEAIYMYIFVAAQLLHGAGAAPLFTLGVTYIDENVSSKMSPVYVGIYYSMAVVGPAIGYLAGGQFLQIHTDIGRVDLSKLTVSPASGVWVGAWWLGFLLAGFLAFLVAIPILGFPSILPGFHEVQMQKVSEAHHSSSLVIADDHGTSVRYLPKRMWILLRNPAFVFLSIAEASEALILSGLAAFLPKYIESQFNMTASRAAVVVGCVTVTAGGIGTFLGGYLVKKFQLHCSGIMKMCVICTAMSLLSCTFFIFCSCPDIPLAGVNVPYHSGTEITVTSLANVCSDHCHCSENHYEPVCGADNIMYYSPCFAGCTWSLDTDSFWDFSNCSCIALTKKNSVTVESSMATTEPCLSSCDKLVAFLIFTFISGLFTFLSSMPALSATLRCVEEHQRSLALGIQWIVVRLLGSITGPIIFGAFMDFTCVLWQTTCDYQGSCRSYDNQSMNRYISIVGVVVKIISTSSFFLAVFLYKTPPTIADSVTAAGDGGVTTVEFPDATAT